MIIRCQGIATCPAQVAILGDCQQSALRERLAVIGAPLYCDPDTAFSLVENLGRRPIGGNKYTNPISWKFSGINMRIKPLCSNLNFWLRQEP